MQLASDCSRDNDTALAAVLPCHCSLSCLTTQQLHGAAEARGLRGIAATPPLPCPWKQNQNKNRSADKPEACGEASLVGLEWP